MLGWSAESSFQGAFALLAVCSALSYLWFLRRGTEPAARGA